MKTERRLELRVTLRLTTHGPGRCAPDFSGSQFVQLLIAVGKSLLGGSWTWLMRQLTHHPPEEYP
jgi:hypothetical protein